MILSTHFYVQLYGIRCMAEDHSDSGRGNLLWKQWASSLFLYLNAVTKSMVCAILSVGWCI